MLVFAPRARAPLGGQPLATGWRLFVSDRGGPVGVACAKSG